MAVRQKGKKIMKKSASKKMLVASAAALSLSALFFAGTTYAWFTDSASSAVSTIQSGNLKIGFQVWDGSNYVDIDEDVDVFDVSQSKDGLWEPGHVETAYVRIKNEGSLSLKYELNLVASANSFVNVNGETTSLSQFIKYGYEVSSSDFAKSPYEQREDAVAALTEASVEWKDNAGSGILYKGELEPSDTDYTYIALTAWMPESTGNDANYDAELTYFVPQINYKLYLSAAQTPDEEDSFGPDYDQNAEYDKTSSYITSGYNVISSGNINTDSLLSPVVLTGDVTVSNNEYPEWSDYVSDDLEYPSDEWWEAYMKYNEAAWEVYCSNQIFSNYIVDLNGNSIIPASDYNVVNPYGDTIVDLSNGTYLIGDVDFGTMYIEPDPDTKVTANFTKMNFVSTKPNYDESKTYASPELAVQLTPQEGSSSTFVFTDCMFDQTYVEFFGLSDEWADIDVTFKNCTFNLTGESPVIIGNYLNGHVSFENCTFNLTTDSSWNRNTPAVESYMSNNVTVSYAGSTINGYRYGTTTEGYVTAYDGDNECTKDITYTGTAREN